ncbi:MAG: DNA gyrase inhibitor YacG [Verrucomicrobia bacterium]|nr:DNA gyrase inhibitor YacG [Verrucomicrobiota bacterium]
MSRKSRFRCPTCRKEGDWFAGAYAPFCSHRCKLLDLGKWLGEEHVLSEPLRPEHLEQFAELPPGPNLDRPETA